MKTERTPTTLFAKITVIRFPIGLTILMALAAMAASGQETISFPARLSDLPTGSVWAVNEYSEGCCTLDFNVRRWESGSWKGGSSGTANTADYTFDVPLYAPASGVIASCWRNFPENTAQGAGNRHPDFPAKIFGGGNHVVILTDQGNAISLNHFKQGTIPAALCPRNAGSQTYPSTMKKEGEWRIASYIEPADRPRVSEGDFLGRAGNTGQSTGPHLHISLKAVTGTDSNGRPALANASSALRFRQGWGHAYNHSTNASSGGWFRLRGESFTGNPACTSYQADAPNCKFKMLIPAAYLRRTSASAGAVKETNTLFLSGNRAVTATISSDNSTLKLITWDLVGVNQLNRRGENEAGAAKEVSLAEPLSNFVLAAVRQTDDTLKMIAYQVGPTGNVIRHGDISASKIAGLAMATTTSGDKKAVTAVRTQSGNLKIIVWDMALSGNGTPSIVRLGEDSAGAVSAVAISRARNFNGVFIAVRDSNGELKVIPYKISADGRTVTRGTVGEAGKVGTAIAVAPLAQGVAAAVRDEGGKLRLITWSVSSNGDIGQRRSTMTAGAISEVSLLTAPHGGSNLTSVVRDGSGNLLLVGWAVNNNGTELRRLGSSDAGAATKISADVISRSYPGLDPRDMILTSLRDDGGNLKLVTWDTNLVNP